MRQLAVLIVSTSLRLFSFFAKHFQTVLRYFFDFKALNFLRQFQIGTKYSRLFVHLIAHIVNTRSYAQSHSVDTFLHKENVLKFY